jgi:hypothetical protein
MAGTGHGYEVANIGDVRSAIDALRETASRDHDVAAWLAGRSFLRYATSQQFVFRIRKNSSRDFLSLVTEADREFIVRKLDQGGDVRLFSAAEFGRAGPDVPHILDWMDHLRETRPQECGKIPRMGAEDLLKKVSSWIRPRSRGTALPEGEVRHVMDTADGYVWLELLDRTALQAEGDAMSHCVDGAAYARKVEEGEARILSMRNPEGRRLLTMELNGCPPRSPLRIRQIQAFANGAPPEGAIESICAALNHLGVAPGSELQERRARVTFSEATGWQSIFRTWKRIDHGGLECITDGNELLFMSPVHPERPLAAVTSFLPSAFRSLGDEVSVPSVEGMFEVRLADERHFTIEELRAAAWVVNAFKAVIKSTLFARGDSGECIPYVDTLVEQEADGIVFLRDTSTENAYVTNVADKALVLLEIGKVPRLGSDKGSSSGARTAWAYSIPKWRKDDLLRCLTAMTAMGATTFGTSWEVLRPVAREYEPVRTSDGRWRSFLLDATRARASKPDHHWLETDYRLALSRDDRRVIDLDIAGTMLRSFPYTWPSGIDCSVVAARLNRLGIVPSGDVYCSRIGTKLGKKRSGTQHVVCAGGRWKAVRSQLDLLRHVADVSQLTCGEARIILHALPQDPQERIRETDALYMACTSRILIVDKDAEPRMPHGNERKPLLWFYENLHMLGSGDRKAAVKHAARILASWSKQPKSLLAKLDDHISIFMAVWQDLPKTLFARVIRHIFKKNRHWLSGSPQDIRWVREIYPSVADPDVRAMIYMGIDRGASAMSGVSDPRILLVNAACLQVCARHDRILLDYRKDTIMEALGRLDASLADPKQRQVLAEVARIMDTLPEIVAEREAAAERRRREFDEMFARHRQPIADAA